MAIGDGNHANDSLTGTFVVASAPPGWYAKTADAGGTKASRTAAGWRMTRARHGSTRPAATSSRTSSAYNPVRTPGRRWRRGCPAPKASCRARARPAAPTATAHLRDQGQQQAGVLQVRCRGQRLDQKNDVPLGPTNKKVKGGTDIVWAYKGRVGSSVPAEGVQERVLPVRRRGDSWHALPRAPIGATRSGTKVRGWRMTVRIRSTRSRPSTTSSTATTSGRRLLERGPASAMPIVGQRRFEEGEGRRLRRATSSN